MSPSTPRPPVQTTGWTRPAIPLQWALFVSHVGMFALPTALLLVTGALARDQFHQREKELRREAVLAAEIVEARLGDRAADPIAWVELQPRLESLAKETGLGVRLVDPAGTVIVSNGPGAGSDLAAREEVTAALLGTTTAVTRRGLPEVTTPPPANAEHRAWTFAASPVRADGEVVGAVLVVHANRRGVEVLGSLVDEAGWRASLVASLALGAASFASWRVSRSLRALARVALEVSDRGERGDQARWLLDATVGTRIAEVRQVARSFRDTLRRLEERLAYNQEFAANVSHEFRTPLTTLRGTVDVLRDDEDMPPEQRRRFLENARTDLDRLLRAVQGLYDLARVDAGTGQERVSLGDVCREVLGRTPGVAFEGEAGAVLGDAAQLELALRNLVENAQLHGGPNVRVRGWIEGARTGLDVEDDGPGISPANMERVFDRFFTTGRDRQGTGLGLALVRAIARAHGGEVTVRSEGGRTVFRLELVGVGVA